MITIKIRRGRDWDAMKLEEIFISKLKTLCIEYDAELEELGEDKE